MSTLLDLEAYTNDLSTAVKTLISYCPNTKAQAPIPPEVPHEAHQARKAILTTISTLQTLLTTPPDFLHHLAVQTQLLACLQWLGEFQVLACIPLTGSVSVEDVADLAAVPENHLSRIIRMTATAGFLQEPQTGHVAHSALSASFVTKPSYLDAVMFLAGTAAPAALQMTTATQRFGPSVRGNEAAFNIAFGTPITFASTCEQIPKLQRQWPAFLRYGTGINDAEDGVTELLSTLDHFRRGNITVVEVNAHSITRATNLATLYPSIRYVVQMIPPTPPATLQQHQNDPSLSNSNITLRPRAPQAPQPIPDAALYILNLPSTSPSQTSPSSSLSTHLTAELRAHLEILRTNPSASLILTPRVLPDPGSVNADAEGAARTRDLCLLQLANERELELAEITGVVAGVGDGLERLDVVNKMRSRESCAVLVEVKYRRGLMGEVAD
ncbi:hypothetical protein BJX61DRAFT_538913 [Aspergillus egyptiacus]|nr:hypothetical protein BJX61DRAFT_538913 [Aspergillus egyptiacus]